MSAGLVLIGGLNLDIARDMLLRSRTAVVASASFDQLLAGALSLVAASDEIVALGIGVNMLSPWSTSPFWLLICPILCVRCFAVFTMRRS